MEVPEKFKNRTTIWPSNSPSGYLFEETPNTNLKRHMHPYVHCSFISNSQDTEAWTPFCKQNDTLHMSIYKPYLILAPSTLPFFFFCQTKYFFFVFVFQRVDKTHVEPDQNMVPWKVADSRHRMEEGVKRSVGARAACHLMLESSSFLF